MTESTLGLDAAVSPEFTKRFERDGLLRGCTTLEVRRNLPCQLTKESLWRWKTEELS